MVTSRNRFARAYRAAAVILLNTLLLLLFVNLALFIYFRVERAYTQPPPVSEERWAALERVYPGMSREEIGALLAETRSPARTYVYEPFIGYKDRPYAGRFINILAEGFRLTRGQGPWPPDRGRFYTVFLFGGSTAYGWGLPDDQTPASHLQEALPGVVAGRELRVYNFARPGYFSTHERILFERLITAGFAPDMAVFVDGLNDFMALEDRPRNADGLERLFMERAEGPPEPSILERVPLARAVRRLKAWAVPQPSDPDDAGQSRRAALHDGATFDRIIQRYARSKGMIDAVAGVNGVRAVFVWQPVSVYKYDLRYHAFADLQLERYDAPRLGYPRMAEFAGRGTLGDNFIWCADIQEGLSEPLYVDAIHYTDAMSRRVAACITDGMTERNLLPR